MHQVLLYEQHTTVTNTSKHIHHNTCMLYTASQWLQNHQSLISSLRQTSLFWQNIILSDVNCLSCCSYNTRAHDTNWSLPALPVCCIMDSVSDGGPHSITWRTLGQSNPMPNAIVAITTRSIPSGSQNDLTMDSFTSASVHLQNMSTSLFLARSSFPCGSVKSC